MDAVLVLVLFILLVIILFEKTRCYSMGDNLAFQSGFSQAFQPSLPRVDQFDLNARIGSF
ncbi:hypothetical protein [Bacillus sp. SM2101]|uniref:hypothetical protein n=1 Tax=Bacillus sp. SM2101 TaxID=2805366 RepID=UPI001BDF0CA7|nr:hypothetical protein [Bacillus sp. SM2101]